MAARTTKKRSTTPATAKRSPKGPVGLSTADKRFLAATPANFADAPDIAVKNLVQEARELGAKFVKLEETIVARSELSRGTGAELTKRLGRLETAESAWLTLRERATPGELTKLRVVAEGYKRAAFASLRYFCREDNDVQVRLDAIAEGSGDADLIDDLRRLAELLLANAKKVAKADLPKGAPSLLGSAADALAHAIAERAATADAAAAMELRNRALWSLRSLMDDIRAAGRYVFRDQPPMLALFRASMHRHPSKKPVVVAAAAEAPGAKK